MTGNNSTPGEKLRALFLAALMVGSVFAAGVAFTGTVAATANSSISANPSSAGSTATHTVVGEVEAADDGSSLNDFQVDYSVGSNPSDVSNVDVSDVARVGIDNDNDGTIETDVSDDLDSASASNNGETITFGFGGTYSLTQGDDVIVEYGGVQNPGASGTYSVDVAINTQSTDNPSTSSLTIGAASNVSVDASGDTTVGDDITVTISTDANETVDVENIVDGEVRESFSATDDDGDGSVQVTVTAGKTYGAGNSQVSVTDSDGNTVTEPYATENYLVTLEEGSVIQGETTTIYGSIYEYPGSLVTETVDYSLQYDPDVGNQIDDGNETVLASSDTGNGEFQVRRTFDEVDDDDRGAAFLNDYPVDGAMVDMTNQPSYVVYVDESATSDADNDSSIEPADYNNQGHAQIDTRLNVEGDLSANGTAVETPTYKQTIDVVNGMVSNADGGLGGYALRVEDPTGSTQKTTQSAQDGSFGFTLEMNDAGTWNLGTNEGAFIGYQNITVAPQEADLEFTAEGSNLATFQETYNIQLNDSEDGFALNTEKGADTSADQGHVRGYINVTGPFLADYNDGDTFIGSQSSVIAWEDTSDGVVDYIHVATDDNGNASFKAVPTQGADVTASLELNDGSVRNGLEEAHDAANSPSEPDYTASEDIPLGGAQPVNIIDPAVEDPQTANADASWQNSGDFSGTYTDILTDDGPAIVEVLPLANTTGERINNGLRFGNDVNQNLEGMTVYRVTFELRNDTNQPIDPVSDDSSGFNYMEINGAGVDATLYADDSYEGVSVDSSNGNAFSGNHFDVDGDGREEYMFLVRPTSTDEPDEQLAHKIKVAGENPVYLNLSAAGLSISQFQVNGEETDSIRGDQNITLTSTVQAPYDDNAPVNNGLVRLIQTGADYDLDTETDARTSNVNDGEYTFEDISLGPRGIDSNDDGLADSISQLVFTAYQYTDQNPNDKALERQEVDRAAVRTVELSPDSTLQVEYMPENTSMYSGFKPNEFGETFTLTKGVEYNQIAFRLTTESGEPVDLTEGIGGQEVALNDLADATVSGENFVKIVGADQDDNQVSHAIHFNESASNATTGYYVIDDIEDASGYVDSENGGAPQAGDVFGFNDNSARNLDTFQLQVTTPDASYTTNESTQGYFNVEEPSIETDILGVNVNETTLDTYGVDHDTDDTFTSVSDVDNMTVDIDRWYRVKGQVTDALGTPINGTMMDDSTLQYVEDGAFSDQPDRADVYFINGWGNNGAYRNNFGNDTMSNSTTFNDNVAGINLNNESGYVLYDIKPTHADNDGSFTPQYSLQAYEGGHGWSDEPTAYWQDTPYGQLPRVQVYDQSGAKLPVDEETGNQILANDVTQTLRIESFPADQNDFPVPQLNFAIDTGSDPVAENTINTLTNLEDDSVLVTDNDDYLNIPYEFGQVGYLTVTPTGTGDGVIALRSGSAAGPITKTIEGDDIVFDVLRSNKRVNLDIAESSVTPGSTVNATVTAAATGEPISLAEVSLEDTNGNVIETNTTNENGVVPITIPESAQLGEYSVFTRPAGYQPITVSLNVRSPAQLDTDLELFAQSGQVVSGTSSADEGTTYTIEVSGPGYLEDTEAEVQADGTFSAEFDLSSLSAGDEVTASIAGVDSVTYTLQSPPTATITMNPQVSQDGEIVTVDEVFLPEGGYVVIHNASSGDVIGHTAYFDPGTYEDVDVLLDQRLAGGPNQVQAMAHMDTNGNEVYDFPGADGPYTANGAPVTDNAQVSVQRQPTTSTPTPTTSTPTPTDTPTDTTSEGDGDTGDGGGPGFGIAVALVALLGAALLAVRRNN